MHFPSPKIRGQEPPSLPSYTIALWLRLQPSRPVTASPKGGVEETDVGTGKWVDGERGQEHGDVTIAHNFRLHCNSALISVPCDKRRVALDSNHSCCQIGTPSEIELIA